MVLRSVNCFPASNIAKLTSTHATTEASDATIQIARPSPGFPAGSRVWRSVAMPSVKKGAIAVQKRADDGSVDLRGLEALANGKARRVSDGMSVGEALGGDPSRGNRLMLGRQAATRGK